MARNFTVGVDIVATDRASGTIAGVESRLDGLRSSVSGFAAAVGPALATVAAQLAAIGAAAAQAAEQEDALVRLRQALQGVAGGAEEALTALSAQADALQLTTRFTDDQINQAQARIAAFVKEGDAIELLTKLSTDFAAAKKIDVVQAADLLTKAVASETNALARYGIAVEGAAGSTERLASVAEGVAAAFGGQAQAAVDTFSGRVDRLKKALGELVETWGQTVIEAPRLNGVLESISGVIERYTQRVKVLIEADRDHNVELDKQSAAFERQMASMIEVQSALDGLAAKTREARIEAERLAEAQSAEIAASDAFLEGLKRLGVTLETDVNEQLRKNAELVEQASEAYRRGELSRRDFEAIERAVADANRDATAAISEASPAVQVLAETTAVAAKANRDLTATSAEARAELVSAGNQAIISAGQFDKLADAIGLAAAVQAALAAGAHLTSGGSRIRFGSSGSRLTRPPGLTGRTVNYTSLGGRSIDVGGTG